MNVLSNSRQPRQFVGVEGAVVERLDVCNQLLFCRHNLTVSKIFFKFWNYLWNKVLCLLPHVNNESLSKVE